jgi:chemotaxis protein MotB
MNSSRFPSNWELSSVRSSAVVRALMIQGIAPARLTAVGYADTRAVVDVETIDNDEQLVQAREKNRRIVFMITRASRDILY